MNLDKKIFLATQKNAGMDVAGEKDIYSVGTVGTVLQLLRLPDGTVKALVEGKRRGRITRFVTKRNYFGRKSSRSQNLCRRRRKECYGGTVVEMPLRSTPRSIRISQKTSSATFPAIDDVSQLADTVSAHFNFKLQDKQELLETESPLERMISFSVDAGGD